MLPFPIQKTIKPSLTSEPEVTEQGDVFNEEDDEEGMMRLELTYKYFDVISAARKLASERFDETVGGSIIEWDQNGLHTIPEGRSFPNLETFSTNTSFEVIKPFMAANGITEYSPEWEIIFKHFCTAWDDKAEPWINAVLRFKELFIESSIKETDDEIKTLIIIKDCIKELVEDSELEKYVRKYVFEKYVKEWHKYYLGTKNIHFDGPSHITEESPLSLEDISSFISELDDHDGVLGFADNRLRVGYTERQARFTAFIRNYPLDVLDWLEGSIPCRFYKRLSLGGDYELFGVSKEEFLTTCCDKTSRMHFEYATVLEEKYGIDFAIDYLFSLDLWMYLYDLHQGAVDWIIELFTKACELDDNERALIALSFTCLSLGGKYDLAIKSLSRLAKMWKTGLISNDWLTNIDMIGLLDLIDFKFPEEEYGVYDDLPSDGDRVWLLMLLNTDCSNDIADYLKPSLQRILGHEKIGHWDEGVRTIESFLERTADQ